MKIFRLRQQKKWHIINPLDNDWSLCRERYTNNQFVEEVTEYKSEKLCNICVSRAYKRGYIGLYPRFVQVDKNKINSITNKKIRDELFLTKNNH